MDNRKTTIIIVFKYSYSTHNEVIYVINSRNTRSQKFSLIFASTHVPTKTIGNSWRYNYFTKKIRVRLFIQISKYISSEDKALHTVIFTERRCLWRGGWRASGTATIEVGVVVGVVRDGGVEDVGWLGWERVATEAEEEGSNGEMTRKKARKRSPQKTEL